MDGLDTHVNCTNNVSTNSATKRERSDSPSDCMSPDTMNPPSPTDSSIHCNFSNSAFFQTILNRAYNWVENQIVPVNRLWDVFILVAVLVIQGLPSLNVGILHSCRGPQIKINSVKIFCNILDIF